MVEKEKNSFQEHERKRLVLVEALARDGIILPDRPGSSELKPNKWLVRGESNKSRLMRAEAFYPRGGQMGSYGVFLGDCLSSLMYPSPGAYYVLKTDDLNLEWLITGSEQYTTLLKQVAHQHNLDLNLIGNGIEADYQVYKAHPIYDPGTGIATLNFPIPLEMAQKIYVTSTLLSVVEFNMLQHKIQDKISILTL